MPKLYPIEAVGAGKVGQTNENKKRDKDVTEIKFVTITSNLLNIAFSKTLYQE